MYRLIGIAIVLSWISAMAALFVRDVYPAWTAQDAPPMTPDQFAKLVDRSEQMGIFAEDGARRGTAWSSATSGGGNTIISGTVHIEGIGSIANILIETGTEFDPQGELDSFRLDVYGVALPVIRVHGERHGIYFPCELQVGPIRRQANLDTAATRMVGDAFRPFNYLPTLKVGQSWRMQVVDPISAAIGGSTQFTPIIARVTGKETIPTASGKPIECFVVETSPGSAKAWVGPDGKIYVQQVMMPGLGRFTIRDEEFHESSRAQARELLQRAPHSGNGRPFGLNSMPLKKLRKTITDALGGGGDDGSH